MQTVGLVSKPKITTAQLKKLGISEMLYNVSENALRKRFNFENWSGYGPHPTKEAKQKIVRSNRWIDDLSIQIILIGVV